MKTNLVSGVLFYTLFSMGVGAEAVSPAEQRINGLAEKIQLSSLSSMSALQRLLKSSGLSEIGQFKAQSAQPLATPIRMMKLRAKVVNTVFEKQSDGTWKHREVAVCDERLDVPLFDFRKAVEPWIAQGKTCDLEVNGMPGKIAVSSVGTLLHFDVFNDGVARDLKLVHSAFTWMHNGADPGKDGFHQHSGAISYDLNQKLFTTELTKLIERRRDSTGEVEEENVSVIFEVED